MRRRKIAGLLLLFVLAGVLRIVLTGSEAENAPLAESGVIDLRNWRFAEEGPVELAGEWLFEPGRFRDPSAAAEAPDMRTVRVPGGGWNGVMRDGGRTPFGAGTYVLTVLLPEPDAEAPAYGVRTVNVRSAHALYADGERIGGRGRPGLSRAETAPDNVPYAVPVETSGPAITFVIHAANYHYAAQGGLFEPPTFGLLPDIYRHHERAGAFDGAVAATFAGCGLVLLLFYLFRRRSTEFGYFGLVFLLAAAYWLTHGNKLLAQFIPDVTYTLLTRVQLLSTVGVTLTLLLFVRALFPGMLHPAIVKIGVAASVLQAVGTLVAPVEYFTRIDPYMVYYGLLLDGYALLAMARGTLTKPDEPLYTFAGVLSMFHYALFQGLYFTGVTNTAAPPPVEIAVFVICMGLLLAKRFLLTLDRVEALSGKLAIANRLKDEFMTNTSYELRTPLRGIINLAELMLDEQNEPRQAERLGLLLASGRRLAYLLDELLDLTKLNEGGLELRLRAVDVRHTAEAVLELTAHLSGPSRKGPPLANRVPPGMPLVRADANRLLQMMLNLVHEALHAAGTRAVDIHAETDPAGRMLWVIVHRQGEAGPQEERLETSVSRKLAELHGGELRIGPASGGGTDVRFSLPIEQNGVLPNDALPGRTEGGAPPRLADTGAGLPAAAMAGMAGAAHARGRERPSAAGLTTSAAAHAAADAAPALADRAAMRAAVEQAAAEAASARASRAAAGGLPAGRGPVMPRVLLADDDPAALQIMSDLLAREGLAVTAVSSGAQALVELERRAEWELVVSDTMLPVISGLELCRQIRQRFSLADLPVLLMTRRGGTVDLLVGFEAGASDMIVKPLDTAEFTGRVRTLIRMKQSVKEQLLTEMALMQAQIKPHFLFNTLNTIAGLSESDPERMRELLHDFGQYLRASFDSRNLQRLVPFEQEWSLVTTYLQIEQARFGARIRVEASIEPGLRFRLPPLTVQPIVENALRHGILKRFEGGTIAVTVAREAEDGEIRIEVRDDGVGFPEGRAEDVLRGTHDGGIGLTNVHRRLMAYYGRGLEIESERERGSVIRFRIPIEEGK